MAHGPQHFRGRGRGRANYQNSMEHISISIICMTHNQNNMALPAVYVVDLIILLSIVTRENMI